MITPPQTPPEGSPRGKNLRRSSTRKYQRAKVDPPKRSYPSDRKPPPAKPASDDRDDAVMGGFSGTMSGFKRAKSSRRNAIIIDDQSASKQSDSARLLALPKSLTESTVMTESNVQRLRAAPTVRLNKEDLEFQALLRMLVHQGNNSASAILGYIPLLENYNLEKDLQHKLNQVLQGAKALSALFHFLDTVSQHGEVKPNFQAVDLNKIFNDIALDYEDAVAKVPGLSLKIEQLGTGQEHFTDKNLLKWTIQNPVENALKSIQQYVENDEFPMGIAWLAKRFPRLKPKLLKYFGEKNKQTEFHIKVIPEIYTKNSTSSNAKRLKIKIIDNGPAIPFSLAQKIISQKKYESNNGGTGSGIKIASMAAFLLRGKFRLVEFHSPKVFEVDVALPTEDEVHQMIENMTGRFSVQRFREQLGDQGTNV